MSPRCLILLNAHAASGSARKIAPRLREVLAAQSPAAALAVTETVAEGVAALEALPQGCRVIVAGGDGSISRMLPSLLAGRHVLAVLPLGSGNDTARAVGVHRLGWREALAHALVAPPRAVDVGMLTTTRGRTPFLSSLACGFDAAVGLRALGGPRWLSGQPRYLWATLGEIAALRHWRLRAHADGHCIHDGLVLLASALNTPSYGSGMPAVPHARIDDARLDALIVGAFGRVGTLAMLPRLLTGRHLGQARVDTRAFKRLEVECEPAMPLAVDGEPLEAEAHFTVEACAGALPVVVHP